MDEKDLENLVENEKRFTAVETKLDCIISSIEKITNLLERTTAAESSLKQAHKRLDELKKILEEKTKEQDNKIENLPSKVFWVCGVIMAGIQFIFFLIEKAGGVR